MKQDKPNVIVVVGPTASGKTSLGIQIAKALDGEIVSADSMQIYKGLNVGTAKATEEEQKEIQHHLIDICDIEEKFSVAEYKEKCYEKLDEILAKGKTPVIVGGTGLYINAVVNNMNFDRNTQDEDYIKQKEEYRKELEEILENNGKEYLYNMLLSADKEAATYIHMNNTKRVIRAIEMAKFETDKSTVNERNDLWNKNESKYNFLVIYIDMPREELYNRINQRVEKMEELGVIEEARKLKCMNLPADNTAIQAIGYKEFFDYIDGKISLEESLENLKQGTRRYAKRQVTWFKKLDCDMVYKQGQSVEELICDIKRKINEK